MFRNYFKTAINILIKNKFFSLINITGLTLGITTSLLILIYIENELSYEKFQKNRQNIYRVAVEWGTKGNVMKFAGSMPALAPAINSQIPEVELAVRIKKAYDVTIKNKDNQEIKEENLFYADQGLFRIFSFYLKEGDQEKALTDPFSIILSRKMSVKYFGEEDALGKTLSFRNTPLKITGIIEDIPENTHLKCDFIVSYSTLKAMGESIDQPWNTWGDDLTYILLKKGASPHSIEPKIHDLLLKNAGEWFAGQMKFDIQPLKEIHWDTSTRGDIGSKGNKTYVLIFLSAAVFVLLIACSNFLNLSISQYLGRMKEVGLRKTFGSQRKQLIMQFMTESLVIILISTLISLFLFDGLYKKLYSYLGTTFVMNDSYFIALSFTVIIVVMIVGIVAGGYPALYISKYNPIEILRKETFGMKRKLTLRRFLVMFQFSISIILITGTIIIYRQLGYMRNSNLGFSKENVVLVNFPSSKEVINNKYEVLRDELLKNPNIRNVSGAYTLPGINSQMNIGVRPDGSTPENSVNLQALPADWGFVKSMDLEITDGRDFSKDFSTDQYESVLLNQQAVKALGLTNPIGKKLFIPGDEYKNGVKVIGVVRDFHIQSFQNQINPMLIYINPKMYIYIAIKISPEKPEETLNFIKTAWSSVLPGTNMNYKYLADVYDGIYATEEKTGQLLSLFTVLALFISCLGLFGFTSFTISKRYKEVGIRKVLGVRISQLAVLLTGQFAFWILISGLIACPVAYFLISKWLLNFAFHINIGWLVFAIAVCFELTIVLLTIGWMTLKAATRNPVEALRYE